ncbi:MAG: type II toxin-antitoxin system RelE/ParE family toxin [Minwuia sp.]|nr:type II toxin-antitoxin system RelE/ParE family toxin [Minwuia sp.]
MADYRLSRRAARDVEEILQHSLEQFGIQAADRYVTALQETFNLLAENPLIARERREHDPPVRIFPARRHRVIYVQDGGGIWILRVLHDRMILPDNL